MVATINISDTDTNADWIRELPGAQEERQGWTDLLAQIEAEIAQLEAEQEENLHDSV